MKKMFLGITLFLAATPAWTAESGKSIDPAAPDALYYSGASQVSSVRTFALPAQQVSVSVRVMENGAEANPRNLLISVFDGSGESEASLYFVSSGLQSIRSMNAKWVRANNSSAGVYLFVKGTRANPENPKKPVSVQFEIKLTDSTVVALDQLEVNEVRK